jgi:hypothetical protein
MKIVAVSYNIGCDNQNINIAISKGEYHGA